MSWRSSRLHALVNNSTKWPARLKSITPPSLFILPAAGFSRALTCTASRRQSKLDAHIYRPPPPQQPTLVDLTLSNSQRKTIYALSTPSGKAGIGVVRISGPRSLNVWEHMVKLHSGAPTNQEGAPDPSKMYRRLFVDPLTGEQLDDGLAVYFKGPNSFTTEDVIELHVHSGRAVIASLLTALSRIPFCRPAEPGEFTRRAFLGGRLDLTQVEGLRDLVDAETEAQRRVALRAAGGASKARFEELREGIMRCLASVEALIDFGDTEEIEDDVFENAQQMAFSLYNTIQHYLDSSRHGEIIRSGIRLAIFGPPNAGKSSLLNFLAQREAAIVTSVPGTTRDILELSLDIGGLPVIVSDTAGLRKTSDIVETIGVERATKAVQAADISICVLSLREVLTETPQGPSIEVPPSLAHLISPSTFFLFNKSDLVSSFPVSDVTYEGSAWTVSLASGEGTKEFMTGFADALRERYDISMDDMSPDQAPFITHARQRQHLEQALDFLAEFLNNPPNDVVLGAEALRYAAEAVGKVSGVIGVEDVLDCVFRDFCIGK